MKNQKSVCLLSALVIGFSVCPSVYAGEEKELPPGVWKVQEKETDVQKPAIREADREEELTGMVDLAVRVAKGTDKKSLIKFLSSRLRFRNADGELVKVKAKPEELRLLGYDADETGKKMLTMIYKDLTGKCYVEVLDIRAAITDERGEENLRVPVRGELEGALKIRYSYIDNESGEVRRIETDSEDFLAEDLPEFDTRKAGVRELKWKKEGYLGAKIPITAKISVFYPDVPEDRWFCPAVQDVSEKELMNGYENGTFGAYDEITRGEFATILYRMAGQPETKYARTFPDVKDGKFYTAPAEWAVKKKIFTGYRNGDFGPSEKLTREQLVTVMYRYAKAQGEAVSANADYAAFPDGGSVSEFASDAMKWALDKGIIRGNGDGTLDPQGKVSRAVCAAMISRYTGGDVG